ncbi:MAG: hypothetical protein AB1458_00710 [Bacteroidota bacterium]
MITRKFEHPFYSPVLNYRENTPETDYEKELIRRYLSFLNAMQETRERVKALRNHYYYERMLVEETEQELSRVNERYGAIARIVEEIKQTMIIDINDFPLMCDYFFNTNVMYLEFHKKHVEKLRMTIEENEFEFRRLYEWFESEGESESGHEKTYREFEEYAQELYTNKHRYSLDLSQFDADLSEMKQAWQKVSAEWDALFDLREETVQNTTGFCKRLSAANELAEKLQLDIEAMEEARTCFQN